MEPTQAEPTPDKPPRKLRRRWLIAESVLVLVLVSMISWWSWPRGDARFVGKWSLELDGFVGGGDNLLANVELATTGRGIWKSLAGEEVQGFNWYVHRDHLLLGGHPSERITSIHDWIDVKWEALTGTTPSGVRAKYRIRKITPSRIQMFDPSPPFMTYVLVRLSE